MLRYTYIAVFLILRMGQDLGVPATDEHIVLASGEKGNIRLSLVKIGY